MSTSTCSAAAQYQLGSKFSGQCMKQFLSKGLNNVVVSGLCRPEEAFAVNLHRTDQLPGNLQ